MSGRTRKRSAAITLVLAGSLSGCGEPVPQQDAYASLNDCVKDWNEPAQCQPVRDGRYAHSYYYGPAYFGSSYPDGRPRPSHHAMDAVARPKALASGASFTSRSSAGNRISTTGTPARSASTGGSSSRGGFGSTASARSSGG